MTKNKINIYVNSKHYSKNNDIEITLPPALVKCDPKTEYLVLNINGWIMKNDFYSTQDSNNKYSITICNIDGSGEITYSFTIPEGNYNVLQMLKILNDNLNPHSVIITYTETTNKYTFKNTFLDTKKIILNPDTAYDFLGFRNGTVVEILPLQSILSEKTINMAGDELVVLQMPNLQFTYPLMSNFKGGVMIQSNIVAYLPINAPPYALLEYNNEDAGDSFSYRLENTQIDSIRLLCFNQDSQNIQVGDYQLNFQFEIHKKITEYDVLKRIERLVSNIFQIAGRDIK